MGMLTQPCFFPHTYEGRWRLTELPQGLKVNCRRKEYMCKLALKQFDWDAAKEHAAEWNPNECSEIDALAMGEAVYEDIMQGRLISCMAFIPAGEGWTAGYQEGWLKKASRPGEEELWQFFPSIFHFLY